MPPLTQQAPPDSSTAEPDLGPREYVRAVRRLTVILLAVGVVARIVRYAVGAAVWGDEAMLALNFLGRDYAGLTRTLDGGQVAPVFFLWAERTAVTLLGTSEWAMRLLPFLAGVAGLFVVRDLARKVAAPTAVLLTVGTLAVATWPVMMAGTLKPYAGDLLASAVLLALAVRGRQRPEAVWPLATLTAVVPLAIGASYPTVFVAGGVAVYLLPAAWFGDRRTRLLYAAYLLLMAGAFAAVYWNVARQQGDPKADTLQQFMRAYWSHGFPPSDPVKFVKWFLGVNSGRMMAYPAGDSNGGSAISLLLFLAGAWRCWRDGRRSLLVLLLTPFLLTFVAAVLGRYPYGGCCRVAQHLAPSICVLIGIGWADLTERLLPTRRTRLKWVTVGAVLLALVGVGHVGQALVKPSHEDGDWARRLAKEVSRHKLPGDRVFVAVEKGLDDACFQWYTTRFAADARPPESDTRRVWLIVLGANFLPPVEEPRLLGEVGPGWATVARAEYQRQPDPAYPSAALRCTIRCLARPGDPAPPPVLLSAP